MNRLKFILARNLALLIIGVFILNMGSSQSTAARSIDELIIGIWLFDQGSGDTAEDSSGHGHDGKLIKVPKWVDGKFSQALQFERAQMQYVEVKPEESLDLTTFSILAWVKVAKPIEWQGILAKQVGTTGPNYGLWINPTGELHSDVGGPTINGKTQVTDGKWHHVGVTSDSKKLQLYFDGTLDAEAAGGIGKPNTEPLTIGRPSTTSPSVLEGILDEVVLANDVLEEDKIKEMMEEGLEAFLAVEASSKLPVAWGRIKVGE